MDFNAVIQFVQEQFTDGLVVVVGSGLSVAEGLPGMPELAGHLSSTASLLSASDMALWRKVEKEVHETGLEAALLKYAPTDSLENWIVDQTSRLLLVKERQVVSNVIAGRRSLRLTTFLGRILVPANGLPILTPNYDRLVEVACEMAGLHVDTTAVGHYAGTFDHSRSCMASCRDVVRRGKTISLDHHPRAVVLKPHGSLDWFRYDGIARRCSIDIDGERLIITPGLNKYKAGYDTPFDKHRELANNYINQAARLLVIGYGFNDDHLQTHLVTRIRSGTPTLILTRTPSQKTRELVLQSANCICLGKPESHPGVSVLSMTASFELDGANYWDLEVLTKELLA